MLPYQAVAMDYVGYQRQPPSRHSGSHLTPIGPLSMSNVGVGTFGTHSCLVPPQDLCTLPYYKMPPQPGVGMQSQQVQLEPGILELRKEKSRDAARSRRGKENYEFYELAKMLPLPAAITSQLDKASIIRLTISYLKLRDFSGHGDPPWARETSCASKLKSVTIRRSPAVDLFEQHQGTHILQSLDGFALAVAADGRFLYISETVSIYLGLSQVEMTGSSIFDYIHHSDHAEIAEQLGLSLTSTGVSSGNCSSTGNGVGAGHASPISGASDDDNISHGTNNPDVSAQMTVSSTAGYKGYERSFCVRMKSTLTKRGCHFKSSGYRANGVPINNGKNGKTTGTHYSVVLLLCKLRPQYTFSHTRKTEPPLLGMVALAIALPPPSVHEIRLECDMFVTRISFDFKIAHVEPRVSDLLDYSPEDLINRSMYALCHAEDADRLRKSHSDLIEKGQVLTGYFRFMNKRSGYIYMQCCATVVCSTKNSDEQNIICVNYVISNCESQNLVLDTCQLEVDVDVIKREEQNNEKSSGPDSPANNDPIADSQANQEQNSLRTKTETDSQTHSNCITSGRSTNTPSSQSSGSANRVKETRTPPSSLEEPDPCTASTTNGLGNIKRKRKGKTAFVPIQHHAVLNDTQSLAKMITISNCLINETATTDTAQNKKPEGGEPEQEQNVESSVRDLEHAMSKHLPTHAEVANGANVSTDFSTNSLLKQQHQQQQQQEQGEKSSSSTIQWIGSAPTYRQPSPMPATALLRQLYANRESVIRATARQTPTGVFYGESSQNATLPTPPSSESSYEQQYLHLHSQKPNTSTDAFTNLVSTYGGYHSTLDYHNTMTPPSSVSPREPNSALNNSVATTAKVHEHTPNADGIDAVVVGGYEYGADPLRPQYANHGGSENVAPTLLLKPQPYSAAAIHHSHATTDVVYNNLDQHPVSQSQYFTHSSFHLYHKGASAGGWYSTPT